MLRIGISLLLVCWSALTWALEAVELTGRLEQGAVVYGKVPKGVELTLDGQPVSVAANGQFALGFDRDAPKAMTLSVRDASGDVFEQSLSIKGREYKIQRIEGIKKSIMSPSEQSLTRIRAESKQVRQARAKLVERLDFAGPFQWPLVGPITGVYGSQRVYNGVPKRPHYGVDVAAPTGTPLTTPAPGVVTLAHPNMFYSGGTLIVDHGHGLSSTLMHLSKVLVKAGDEVVPGDIVAEVGATGRATGPHLDWRMNWFKARVDPELLVGPMPKTLILGSE